MLNVRDECDLPEDDGYDLFTRETEVERRRKGEPKLGTRPRIGGWLPPGPSLSAQLKAISKKWVPPAEDTH